MRGETVHSGAKHWALWVVLAALLGLANPAGADDAKVIVSLPVHGKLVFTGNIQGSVSGTISKQLLLADTFSGNVQTLFQADIFIESPVWNSTGDQIAYQNGSTPVSIFDLSDHTQAYLMSLDSVTNPQDFSPDNTRLLYIRYFSPLTPPAQYEVGIIDLHSDSPVVLYSYEVDGIITDVPFPPLPPNVPTLKLSDIYHATWNPVYPDWIVLQLVGYSTEYVNEDGYPRLVSITFAYNLQTRQQISLDRFFPSTQISAGHVRWSPDGNYLALETDEARGFANILAFTNNEDNWSFSLVDSASSEEQVILDWLGAGNLLLTGKNDITTGDSVVYIAQIINGGWHSREFLRFPQSIFHQIGQSDWHITASDEEKQTLACLFGHAPEGMTCENASR